MVGITLGLVHVFGLWLAAAQSSSADSARAETPGPCSRRTPLVISEIMYHPRERVDSNNLEFVEVFNSQLWPEDISGFQLAGAVQYTFPTGTVIAAAGVLVVAADPAAVGVAHGITNVLGPFAGRLENQGEELRLLNRSGAVLLEVPYSDEPPWPVAADGAGHSVVLARPSFGEGDARSWAASDLVGGSPGRLDSLGTEPLRVVMINELLAHTTDPEPDFLELYNHSNQPADLSNCHLTDDPMTNKFTFPSGITLGPRAFLALDQTQLGFALSSGGETIYLINSNSTRVLDAVRFGAQALGVSYGRSPDGSTLWSKLANKTPGLGNSAALTGDIIINEIMYAPLSRDDDDQFVELHNRGTGAVDVGRWRFVAGIDFTIPTNTMLVPGGYLVVARNAARMLTHYPNLGSSNLVGDFKGKLSGRGERLAVAMPETVISTNQGQRVTNVHYIVVNELTYGTGGRWGQWADGGGSSLELIDPRNDNRLAANWTDSDETAKAPWSVVQHTGRLEHGIGAANALHLFLMGPGECLVDDVEVIGTGGVNLLANPSFDSGLAPWALQGNHDVSFLQSDGGWNNSPCLHVRSDGDGDPGANKIRVPLTASLAVGANASMSARVRWLRGNPEILLRTAGNYLEAFGQMAVPAHLGTPGARNSRALANAGPAIFDVRHDPVLPQANQDVIVTARLSDLDGLALAAVKYRIDPDTNTVFTVLLVDDGSSGDVVAGDGLFSATIPGQTIGALVAFHVVASDNHPQAVTNRFPNDAPARECLVRFGESQPAGGFGAYRLWVTQATFNNWTARLKLSNAGLDGTFVYENERAIYNVGALYAGSAYHAWRYTSPTGVACDYKLIFPEDDLFLGSDEATIVWPGLTGGDPIDNTAQREPTCYWLAGALGLPFNYQRYVHFFVNAVRRSFIMQDKQKPDGAMLQQWFPGDSDGDLFKVQIWREYNDAATAETSAVGATLGNFITDGVKKTSRYRWSWTPRAIGETANDFADLFALVDAANSPSNTYAESVEATVDIEQWMRTFAAEHLVANWDSYGYGNGQNMYAYKPSGGRWQMMIWDLDVSLGNASDGPTDDLFKLTNPFFPAFNGDAAVVSRMYQHPKFVRAYWRAVEDAVNGPLLSTTVNGLLDARAAAFAANGVSAASPDPIKSFLSSRRNYCVGRLATVAANFAVSTPANLTTPNNLVLLSGTAPVNVRDIVINGVPFPVTWTSVTSWTARVVVNAGTNELIVQGLDRFGKPIDSARTTNTVSSTATNVSPTGTVVINEIMYNPVVPGAAYVELLNTSSHSSFDIGNWRLNGLDYTFPPGSILTNGQHLVLAESRGRFVATYGPAIAVFAEYNGRLQLDGETITLFRPGAGAGDELVVDQVRYEAAPPWPASANGRGASLQLIDPAQDRSRVGNWSDQPRWRFFSYTNTPGANATNLSLFLNSAGELFLDDVWLVEGLIAETGSNLISNGDFEMPLTDTWRALGNHSNSVLSAAVAHRGSSSLRIIATAAGSLSAAVVQAISGISSNGPYTLSFWYLPTTNASGLNFRITLAYRSLNPIDVRQLLFTPGARNALAGSLPPFPAIWINEAQPNNLTGIVDAAGHREPWLELYNASSGAVALGGLYLSKGYDQLTIEQFNDSTNLWPFPPGASLAGGEFKIIWADGVPSETTAGEWHTSFRFNALTGSVAIVRIAESAPQIVDYLNYGAVAADQSFGAIPDGQAFTRRLLFNATPGRSNISDATSPTLFINEWMASNVNPGGYPEPVSGNYEDWFELYNPSPEPVDLEGCGLTDNLDAPFKSVVPAGYSVPAHGYLLVWADGQPSRNSTNSPDLHVSFKLERDGEEIGLFAPDGRQIDIVNFGLQTNNVSQGRFADGAANIYFMVAPTPGAPNVLAGATNALAFTGLQQLPNGDVALSWRSVRGKTYRVQFKQDLNEAQWSVLGDYGSSDESLSIIDPVGVAVQRFYRIREMD